MKYSIVVPAYNEKENLPELLSSIKEIMNSFNEKYEVILVDDGSTDGTREWIKASLEKYPFLTYIRFRKNSGKSAALQAGFDHANGEIIITMDADLQDDPAEIPKLLAKLEERYDLVSCWKEKRQDPISKTLPSKIFNATVRWTTKVKLHDMNCGFKVYRREVVKNLKIYGELHRFIPVLAAWNGFSVTEVPVKHHPRKYGRSKFGWERFFKGFFDFLTVLFLTRFKYRPLHLFGGIGLLFSLLGTIILLYLSVLWVGGVRPIGNRPLFFLGILLVIVGIQFFSTGFIADMIVSGWFHTERVFYPLEEIDGIYLKQSGEIPDQESAGKTSGGEVPERGS